jgi:hypothetical protein
MVNVLVDWDEPGGVVTMWLDCGCFVHDAVNVLVAPGGFLDSPGAFSS